MRWHSLISLMDSLLSQTGYTGPDGAACQLCPVESFKGFINSSSCLACPTGSTTNGVTGSTLVTACKVATVPHAVLSLAASLYLKILLRFVSIVLDGLYW
jgi:hypothetical protein